LGLKINHLATLFFPTSSSLRFCFPFPAQISATALEETKILVWHRDKLKLILTLAEPFLKTVLDHVVARDVVRKLTQVSKFLLSQASTYIF
jgi:hypothetical protein